MNLDRVFISYDIDGKEILIYKKDEKRYINLLSKDNKILEADKIDVNSLVPFCEGIVRIDVNSFARFWKGIDRIDVNSLVLFCEEFELYRRKDLKFPIQSGKNVVKKYTSDREQLLDLSNIYIGKICRVSGIKDYKETFILDSIYHFGGYKTYYKRPAIEYEFDYQVINEETLLLKYNDIFLDLINYSVYIGKSQLDFNSKYNINKKCILDSKEELLPFNRVVLNKNTRYMSKKSILEEYYNRQIHNKKNKVLTKTI